MSVRTVVHLLRHGEVHNPDKILYGRRPGFHLSEAGLAMAQRAADAVANYDVVALRSSPLERALETVEPLEKIFGLTVATDDRLLEATNHFEGKRFGVGDGSLRRPVHWPALINPFRPSWGEPYRHLGARMLAAMADARDAARGHEAICVSHQLPIWITRRMVEGRRLWHDPRRRQCALASLTSFIYDDDEIVAVSYREPAGPAGRDEVGGA